VASQLMTSPKILFLDEPTSGLDSAASYEVMSFVRDIAKKYKVSSQTGAVMFERRCVNWIQGAGYCVDTSAVDNDVRALR
jgi:energy-coupling factor transporter ATP-binding protein EcfA2